MLDGLFTITRDFDMQTQPHLLLLQKTMVMEEGVATALDPDINMWETAEPFLKRMGARRARPRGARSPTRSSATVRLLRKLPDLIRRIDYYYPPPGAAPPTPPLPEIEIVRAERAHRWPGYRGVLADCALRRPAVPVGSRAAQPARRSRGCIGRSLARFEAGDGRGSRAPHRSPLLLIVGGGIAAYKACELSRLIRKGGGERALRADRGRRRSSSRR